MHADARLATAALLHSVDMAKYSYFSHTSRDGRIAVAADARGQGYYYGSAENIAAGQTTASGRLRLDAQRRATARTSSPARTRRSGSAWPAAGYYGIYWTQDFGRR